MSGSLLVLASASPRRRQLMRQVGADCAVLAVDVDETPDENLTPAESVAQIARRKALGALARCGTAVIIAADTLVCLNGQMLGKPRDAAEAFAMLKRLQGRSHTVYTGVSLLKAEEGVEKAAQSFVESAEVFMRPLTAGEITAYVATGEPLDKAGAYGVQERGALLVSRIEGDFYTVVGLPLARLCAALRHWGIEMITP